MITCAADCCVLPAKWQVQLATKSAPHWGDDERIVQLELCFCELHRTSATLDALFTPNARRAMDLQFIARKLPVPDWARTELRFVPRAPNGAEVRL